MLELVVIIIVASNRMFFFKRFFELRYCNISIIIFFALCLRSIFSFHKVITLFHNAVCWMCTAGNFCTIFYTAQSRRMQHPTFVRCWFHCWCVCFMLTETLVCYPKVNHFYNFLSYIIFLETWDNCENYELKLLFLMMNAIFLVTLWCSVTC